MISHFQNILPFFFFSFVLNFKFQNSKEAYYLKLIWSCQHQQLKSLAEKDPKCRKSSVLKIVFSEKIVHASYALSKAAKLERHHLTTVSE